MKMIYSFLDFLIRIGAYIAGFFIVATTFMIFYEVISRAFFGVPTSWATELSIYAIIGSCFLGSAYAVRTYSHITVDLLVNSVNEKLKIVFTYLSNTLGLLFSVIFTIYGFSQVIKTYELGVTSASLLRVPMYLPETLLPLGGLLMTFAFLLQIVDGGAREGSEQV